MSSTATDSLREAAPILEPPPQEDMTVPAPPSAPSWAAVATPQMSFDGNQQRVDRGVAILGPAYGNITTYNLVTVDDGEAEGKIVKPRFREGPYPPDEVRDRLRGFVEPRAHAVCREKLTGRRVLLLRGEAASGTSTAAFALLHEVTAGGRIIGLNAAEDLTRWEPSSPGGYMVQGIVPQAADMLDEVALNSLAGRLAETDAYVVVIVDQSTLLPRSLSPWCQQHIAPLPRDVATALLKRMADEGALDAEQLDKALGSLDLPPFKEYLAISRSPGTGVEVAEELREVATRRRTPEAAADNLRLGTVEAAGELLTRVGGDIDALAWTAALALFEEQDRSVVEQFAGCLKPLLAASPSPQASLPQSGYLLGRAIEDRIDQVQARLLPRRAEAARGYRYWVEPVAFRRKHLAEEVLRRLWLDYEGFSGVLLTWMRGLPYKPGVDRLAGRRIGQVLCQASGPDVLRQLSVFASSPRAWHRRLAAHALGEVVQDSVLSAAVRSQLRQWSDAKGPEVRCTVAETCAGSLGLALPDFALGLLHTVLGGGEDALDDNIRKAVSTALGVLLTEDVNRSPVLAQIVKWLAEPRGSGRHMYAVQSVRDLCAEGFPAVGRAGIRKVVVADLFADSWDPLVPLVLAALDHQELHDTMKAALLRLDLAAGPESHERMVAFLQTLSEVAGGHRGLRLLLIARFRDRPLAPEGEEAR
ncbi:MULTISPECIES: hypothetical protein [unclassified Streptomyces]|uniref:hypothetical protein n=1 Tax=unclassified Streptomyces TaxID=2593676 RepID=UPI0036C81F05